MAVNDDSADVETYPEELAKTLQFINTVFMKYNRTISFENRIKFKQYNARIAGNVLWILPPYDHSHYPPCSLTLVSCHQVFVASLSQSSASKIHRQ